MNPEYYNKLNNERQRLNAEYQKRFGINKNFSFYEITGMLARQKINLRVNMEALRKNVGKTRRR